MKSIIKIDKKMYDELLKKPIILHSILMVVGVALVVASLVLEFVFPDYSMEEFIYVPIFICAVPLAMIILLKISARNNVKGGEILHITLTEDSFETETFKGEEKVGTYKAYYKDVTKVKETKSYLFCYLGKLQMLPLLKTDFSADELQTVKSLLPNKNK